MNSRPLRNALALPLLTLLAIIISPLIIIALLVYLLFIIRRSIIRKNLLKHARQEWVSKGKTIYFIYSDSKRWKTFSEKEILPAIKNRAIIRNWSTRNEKGWNEHSLEARVLKAYSMPHYRHPMGIIFTKTGTAKLFKFLNSRSSKPGTKKCEQLKKEFLQAAREQ